MHFELINIALGVMFVAVWALVGRIVCSGS